MLESNNTNNNLPFESVSLSFKPFLKFIVLYISDDLYSFLVHLYYLFIFFIFMFVNPLSMTTSQAVRESESSDKKTLYARSKTQRCKSGAMWSAPLIS